MANGYHLIAGEWVAGKATFSSAPVTGEPQEYAVGTAADADRAATAAEEAFWCYGWSSRTKRASFLNRIANEIEARSASITDIGTAETGLPEARLESERGRTVGQLRLFADHIGKGDYLDRRHDSALAEREPLPRPELRLMQRPVGPVAVFGPSNFPLAFSTAGADTASALAAGCPVVVKGHPAHPGTCEIVAEAIHDAVEALDMPPGVFSLLQGEQGVGRALVQHPLICAVGFTGSIKAGRALFDLCAARPDPIPFFGELGSVNPVFLLPAALAARGIGIAEGWVSSLTMGAGQFCTNPGIVVLLDGPDADTFTEAARAGLSATGEQVMLTDGIAEAYRSGRNRVRRASGVREIFVDDCVGRNAAPYLATVPAREWLANDDLREEVFGPLGLIVRAADYDEMVKVAKHFHGQLTCTLHLDEADINRARALLPIFERKAGRLIANGFPTGVEVCDAMVHGGPYPASTNSGATSVGTLAIRRFLRPVCYQDMPEALLPADLRMGE